MLELQALIVSIEVGLIYGILAIGIYLTFRTINFPDLTCEGSFVLGATIASVLINSGCNPWISMAAAMVAGGLAGILTGILHLWLKIEDLLAGIIVAFMLYSINLRIMGMNPNITLVDQVTLFGDDNPLPKIVAIVFTITALLMYLLRTDFGLGLRSIGQNRRFAVACGVNVNSMVIAGLATSNALIGMCGAIYANHQGFCDVSQGIGCLVMGLASVIIGEKIMKFSNVSWAILACVIGSVVYRLFIGVAINSDAFGLKTQDLNLITGLMIIAMMSVNKNATND
ncbi:MAG: hypothetical protein LBJ16_01230 [Holosporaceae bacterium]|jgi:putative ABC transport system permease protein|nr:hypothetical protein [Holosporaceae bacterium]